MAGHWLNPVRQALDARESPLTMFVRDDDAGWADERLDALLDLFDEVACPIDLAVIPAELTEARAAWLLERRARSTHHIGLHQHGFAHANHEARERKSEFGRSRSPSRARVDVQAGRDLMRARLGDAVDPVFTPPWNRCRDELGPVLVEAGLDILSRDRSAGVMGTPGLRECPVTVDWCAAGRGVDPAPVEHGVQLAGAVRGDSVLGLMLHHAVMDDDDRSRLAELLRLVVLHGSVRCLSLREAAGPAGADRRA